MPRTVDRFTRQVSAPGVLYAPHDPRILTGDRAHDEFMSRRLYLEGYSASEIAMVGPGAPGILLGSWYPTLGTRPGLRPSLSPVPFRYGITSPPTVAGFVGSRPFNLWAARLRQGQYAGAMVPMLAAPALRVHCTRGALLAAPLRDRLTKASEAGVTL